MNQKTSHLRRYLEFDVGVKHQEWCARAAAPKPSRGDAWHSTSRTGGREAASIQVLSITEEGKVHEGTMGREAVRHDSSPAVDIDLSQKLSSFGNVRHLISCQITIRGIGHSSVMPSDIAESLSKYFGQHRCLLHFCVHEALLIRTECECRSPSFWRPQETLTCL